MVWYFVVALVAFGAGVVVGAWALQRRQAQTRQPSSHGAESTRPDVRLPAQSEFLAEADGPVGPNYAHGDERGPVPGPAQDRDQSSS